MSAFAGVLGCVGLCWVGFAYPTQPKASSGAGCVASMRVCRVFPSVRACVNFSFLHSILSDGVRFFHYANPEKPNKPNTLDTASLKPLIFKGFRCVGFVLGWVILCWVAIGEGR